MREICQGIKEGIRKISAIFFLILCGCTATEKAALKDCVKQIVPIQVIATVEECGLDDRNCAERVAAERALIAADYIAACVEGKKDASNAP